MRASAAQNRASKPKWGVEGVNVRDNLMLSIRPWCCMHPTQAATHTGHLFFRGFPFHPAQALTVGVKKMSLPREMPEVGCQSPSMMISLQNNGPTWDVMTRAQWEGHAQRVTSWQGESTPEYVEEGACTAGQLNMESRSLMEVRYASLQKCRPTWVVRAYLYEKEIQRVRGQMWGVQAWVGWGNHTSEGEDWYGVLESMYDKKKMHTQEGKNNNGDSLCILDPTNKYVKNKQSQFYFCQKM